MPEKDEDIGFTFDTKPITNGIKKVANGITGLTKNSLNMAKNVSKGVLNAAAKIGVMGLAFKGIQTAIKEMPEIGQAFNIAKGIIMKNLLFPLRKAVLPLLQKFLDWVRDNRAMFVKWGQSLVGIFKFVISAVQKIIDVGKKLGAVFLDFINRTFGTQIKTFQDILNIFTFKIAVIIEFMKRLIEPLFSFFLELADELKPIIDKLVEMFNEIIGFVTEITSGFLEGFLPAVKKIKEPIQKIVDAVSNIFDKIFGSSEAMGTWKEVFEGLGKFLGGTFKTTLDLIAIIVERLDDSIGGIVDLFSGKAVKDFETKGGWGAWAKDFGADFQDFFSDPFNKKWWTKEGEKETRMGKWVDDAIIKPGGEIIRTSPEDYLIATKTPELLGKANNTVTLNFPGMNIYLQDGTQQEAETAGRMIVDEIRNTLYTEMESMGMV